ncbi:MULTISPECIES: hypothetical protein [Serratia]|uniref:hypothetical protein n=1 Tax=Serratia TaxID=613 RepID=UPI001013CC55|nr:MULTISPECIES: hypothetical protein [Serratia]
MTDIYTCEILSRQVRISRREQQIACSEIQANEALENTLPMQLQSICSQLPWFRAVRFVLDTSLVNHLVVPWPEGVRTPSELRNYTIMLARQKFPHLSGKPLRVGFEDCRYQRNALAFVLEDTLWQSLYEITRDLKLRFSGVTTPLRDLLVTEQNGLAEEGIFVLSGDSGNIFACRSESEWQQVYRMVLPDMPLEKQVKLVSRLAGKNKAPTITGVEK